MGKLRNKFLAGRKKIGSVVDTLTVKLNGDDVEVNICRPGLKARNKCMQLFETDGGVKDFSKLQAVAVVECLRDLDGDLIFDDSDVQELAETTSCGDWFDVVAPLCVNLVMPSSEGNSGSSD